MVAHSQPKGKMSIYGKTKIILMDGRRKWNIVASRKWIVNKSKNNEFNKKGENTYKSQNQHYNESV